MIAAAPNGNDCRVLFLCDAHAAVGFGHASRCLHLGKLVTRRLSPDGAGPVFAFQGTFSTGARARLASAVPELSLYTPTASPRADVILIDRLADT